MKINCTYNNTSIELRDEDSLHTRLVVQATVGDLIRRLWDVRDPETGQAVKIIIVPTGEGVSIELKSSDALIDEVNRILADNPLG